MLSMKAWLIFFSIFFIKVLYAEQLKVEIASRNAILINADTGKVLYDKKANEIAYPASLTKIATGIYSIKIASHLLDDTFTATQSALKCIPDAKRAQNNYQNFPPYCLENHMTRIGLFKDEKMTFRDLLYALLVSSGGDAGNVIAETLGHGSIERFVEGMNQFLKELGCTNTHFLNPSGQHYPGHFTTAVDMAILCKYAMKDPLFCEIVKVPKYVSSATNKSPARTFVQTNRLLKKGKYYYAPAIGIKTGYTAKASAPLAACAVKDGRKLIAILLNCPDRNQRFDDAKTLFEKAFSEKKSTKEILPKGGQEFAKELEGADRVLETFTKEPLTVSYFPSEEPHIRLLLHWDKLAFPIVKGQKVGKLQLMSDEKLTSEIDLYAKEPVERSLFAKIWHGVTSPVSIVGVVGLVIALFFLRRRRHTVA